MRVVEQGDKIAIQFQLRSPQGHVFAATTEARPLHMVAGHNDVIQGLSKGVIGLEVGKTYTLSLPAAQAFGERSRAIERSIPIDLLPNTITLGDQIRISSNERPTSVGLGSGAAREGSNERPTSVGLGSGAAREGSNERPTSVGLGSGAARKVPGGFRPNTLFEAWRWSSR
jgi:peptidylprolyl isomerase